MTFLFDDENGQSQIRGCPTWPEAERYAEERGWTLIGEFLHWVDEEGGPVYMQ